MGRGQSAYLELDAGYSTSWERRLLATLDAHDDLVPVVRNADAAVYALREAPPGMPEAATPGPPGPTVTWTPWSVLGALSAGLLVLLLGAREFLRLRAAPDAPPSPVVRALFWFAVPLLLVTVSALVHRFWTLA